MKEEVTNLRNQAIAELSDAQTLDEIERIRIAYLGRSGKISHVIKKITSLAPDEKRSVGVLINETKNIIQNFIKERENKIKSAGRKWFDATIPGKRPQEGHLHLVTQAISEISRVFEEIGFVRMRYPEVEWDWYAFGSLNFSEMHPARDEWETFFIDTGPHKEYGPMLLTPHTSSGQVREMKRVGKAPIRMINISKCYRRQSDVSHVPMFHQFEGLVIDQDISIVHLKGTIDYFMKSFYKSDRKARLRPYNFPFTEPSFEIDISCDVCSGHGCKLCKEGWLELGGAGMVHPKVLRNGGIDPKKYSGFAFGWGVERAMIMKKDLGISDLRTMYSTDIFYLGQY